ncbi:ABC transporter ATP-binding protein [Murimonas intestini]|uniref:ABC-2 type transport system ATP-binding protein n=1 Tax=Murimonas intestini TaxID=1337051 RepID=A0AB73T6P1_9FIRM|nr:ABC transporter ATP-binding protein [Murimonas intestini]MCR1866384.1 ABC transporter ATP-binding protein [Murimonas intestini]MCR1882498.1 ABC transporter ATP-binding protein [Murimonas intestini]
MSVILECKNLTKVFGPKTALYGLNLSLESGRIIGLLGPNGSGKTTLIKMINGLISPTEGEVLIDGIKPGVDTKKIVSYLPERSYLNRHIRVAQAVELFSDFYEDFDRGRAYDMLARLHIERNEKLSTMSKGTREKVHLVLVMSRRARLYCLDEPIAGVDPAARDFILSTIINNYDENATILISTHLISDIENILDEVIFLEYGQLRMFSSVDDIRFNQGKSVDTLFREVFKC